MDKREQLEQLNKQIYTLQEQAYNLRQEIKIEEMPKYKDYIGKFIKIEDTTDDEGPLYVYVTNIRITCGGSPSIEGVFIHKEYDNYDCYQEGCKHISGNHKIVPITKFDWDNLLKEIVNKYTIKIPV